ncbi:MAG: phytanoyl-CoA dioxygenase family protein [Phycisphaeraceae bacterium]
MHVRFGQCDYTLDSDELGRLRDSNDLIEDTAALRARLEEDGYLLLRGYLDRETVLRARQTIFQHMAEHEGLEPGSRPLDGVMGVQGKSVPMMGRPPITHHPDVLAVFESPRLFELYQRLFGEPALTFHYKWLRAVGNEECTGAHMDHVYMGRGSRRLHTCWIPIGDIPIEQGTLAICEKTHSDPRFEKLRQTYGRMDVDRDRVAGWFTERPREITETFGGRWLTDNFQAGDILTFGMHLMHASTTNTTSLWRLSCDVRYQPASDPVDERWAGDRPRGHAPSDGAQPKPMQEARAAWGV